MDGWVTYSFSASPAQAGNDKSYPYFGGGGNGYFLHITNYSGTTAPNCVEVQVVKSVEGATETIRTFFLDNALNEKLDFSLAKGTDGKYSLTFAKASDDSVLKSETGLELDAALFINERGQTFLSTAIYEGCDGNHWEHRGMAVFSMQAYTYDAASAEVTLSEDKYEFEEGKTYKPAVTVKVGTKTLAADEDYYVEYADNKAVGTGKAIVYFINEYAGNSSIEKAFVIEEKQAPADFFGRFFVRVRDVRKRFFGRRLRVLRRDWLGAFGARRGRSRRAFDQEKTEIIRNGRRNPERPKDARSGNFPVGESRRFSFRLFDGLRSVFRRRKKIKKDKDDSRRVCSREIPFL
mgnify:CR=1 FL=1